MFPPRLSSRQLQTQLPPVNISHLYLSLSSHASDRNIKPGAGSPRHCLRTPRTRHKLHQKTYDGLLLPHLYLQVQDHKGGVDERHGGATPEGGAQGYRRHYEELSHWSLQVQEVHTKTTSEDTDEIPQW